jgi:hypothetical protein
MQTELSWSGQIENAWIETYSGKQINVFNPKPEDISIHDIAHALSCCARFNGHLSSFLSVAEHSYFVSYYCKPKHALAGLLHDASEAYLSDIPRPIKKFLPQVTEIDDRLSKVILLKWGIEEIPEDIMLIDRQMCLAEADKSNMHTDNWAEGHERYGHIDHFPKWWIPFQAEQKFLNRYYELTRGKHIDIE